MKIRAMDRKKDRGPDEDAHVGYDQANKESYTVIIGEREVGDLHQL